MKRIIISTIVIALMAIVTSSVMMSCKKETLEWPRKYATTVVRGHVNGLPENSKDYYALGIWDLEPDSLVDSAGVFFIKTNLYSPRNLEMHICGVWCPLLLCPGDTLDIEVDYPKLKELQDDREKQYSEAIHIQGAHIQLSPKYRVLVDNKLLWADVITAERKAQSRKSLAEFGEWEWLQHQRRLADIDSLGLDDTEKKHMQLRLEQKYVKHICDHAKSLNVEPRDPHADSLFMPNTMLAAFYFNTESIDYLKVNGLERKPMGRYLEERKQGEDILARIKALHEVSDDEIGRLTPEFRQAVSEFKAQIAERTKNQKDWKPEGAPATWIEQIVERHRGKVVYVDFWATWCGPCNLGIKEMETVKAEYEKRGVYFVYITDNSSRLDGFYDMKKKHSGDHFLFTKDDFKAMNIPKYTGAIPHYLIYGRDGKLVKTLTGWGGLERITPILDDALKQ